MSDRRGLFDSIAEMPLLWGALIDERGKLALARLCARAQVRTIIEVGTFLGMGSTQVFCHALPPEGRVYCVDTFCVDMKRYNRPQDPHYHAFLSNMKVTGTASKVIPVRMTSQEASRALDVVADLVYIDGDHAGKSVREDIVAWMPHVRPGGILCGDDYDIPTCPEVAPTVQEVLPEHQVDGRMWWVEIGADGPPRAQI